MAGEATIGAVRVVVAADIAKLEEGLKNAVSALGKFGEKALHVATGIQLQKIFEQTFHAVVQSIEHAIDTADKLSKASQKFGIPVETLSALSHAAELSDVSLEQLGSSLSRLSKNMVAAQKDTSDQAAAFGALKISVTDANKNLKSQEQVLLEVADKFSRFQDGTVKTALAVALFGRAGADMIPFLNQGAEGLKKMQDRMRELGQIIDGETARAAEQFNDNLKDLGRTKDAIILKILGSSGLLLAMGQLVERFVHAAGDAKNLADVGDTLGRTLQYVVVWIDAVTFALSALTLPFRAIVAAFYNLAQGNFAAAWEAIASRVKATGETGLQAAASIAKLNQTFVDTDNTGDQVIATMDKLAAAYQRLAAAPPAFDPNARANAMKFNDEMKKLQQQALEAGGAYRDKLAPGFFAAAQSLEHLKNQIIIVHGRIVALGPDAERFNQEMLKLNAQAIVEQSLPAWQQFEIQAAKNATALQALGYTSEQVAEVNARAAEKAGVSWKNATADILHNAAAGFAAFAEKNKQFAGIAKGLAIAEAVWNTYQAATKALATYPPPFGEIAAAAAVVAGLGMVAKIQAQGFARGGSFMVPGGIGGIDSQVMPLALTPGERVDITPSAGERGGSTRRSEITLSGIGPRDLFTGTMLRDLIEALNAGERDGYRLKFSER